MIDRQYNKNEMTPLKFQIIKYKKKILYNFFGVWVFIFNLVSMISSISRFYYWGGVLI